MSNESTKNLLYGLSIAQNAQSQAALDRQRANDAERRAMEAELALARSTTGGDLKRKLRAANIRQEIAEGKVARMGRNDALIISLH